MAAPLRSCPRLKPLTRHAQITEHNLHRILFGIGDFPLYPPLGAGLGKELFHRSLSLDFKPRSELFLPWSGFGPRTGRYLACGL